MSGLVSIRPVEADDCEVLASWLSRPDVNRWLGSRWRGGEVDPRRLVFALKEKSNRFFMIVCAGERCGLVAISDLDMGDRFGLVWYFLGEDRFRGQGVTTTAVRLVAEWAFSDLGLAALWAWVHPGNGASVRVLEKVGFRPAGRLREAAVLDEARVDRILFDLTADEWRLIPHQA